MMPPALPDDYDGLDEIEQDEARQLYFRRLMYYHYIMMTAEFNEAHTAAMDSLMQQYRSSLFIHASNAWDGETLPLKIALIETTERWMSLAGGGVPCPLVFDANDVRTTKELDESQKEADANLIACRNLMCIAEDGRIPSENYGEALSQSKHIKGAAMATVTSEEERAEILEHWPFDDMDEEPYK